MTDPIPQFYKGAIDASGCISNAWNLIKTNYWMFFLVSLLTYVLIACIPCLNVFLLGPVMGGVYHTSLRAMRGEPVEFGMMFKGFEKFVPLMIVGLVQSVPSVLYQTFDFSLRFGNLGLESILSGNRTGSDPTFFQQGSDPNIAVLGGYLAVIIVVSVVLIIFSILWAITFAFVVPITMENEISPIEAMKLSARASWGNVGGLLLLAILSGLLGLAGAIVLCVGFFFVLPVIWVAWAFAYRQVFPDFSPTIYRNEPPPPDVYHGNFGQGM